MWVCLKMMCPFWYIFRVTLVSKRAPHLYIYIYMSQMKCPSWYNNIYIYLCIHIYIYVYKSYAVKISYPPHQTLEAATLLWAACCTCSHCSPSMDASKMIAATKTWERCVHDCAHVRYNPCHRNGLECVPMSGKSPRGRSKPRAAEGVFATRQGPSWLYPEVVKRTLVEEKIYICDIYILGCLHIS